MRIGIRVGVAVAIMLPLLVVFRGGWAVTFAIALIGFGTGRTVEQLLFGPADSQPQGRGPAYTAAAMALIGVVLLAGLQFFQHRTNQTRTEAIEDLRRTRAAEVAQPEEVWRLDLLADGTVRSNGVPTEVEALTPPAGAVRAEILAHPSVAHERVIAVMDRVRTTGLPVGLAGQPPQSQ